MFDPKIIFLILWSSQVFLHILFQDSFDKIDNITWLSILFAFTAFNLGAGIVLLSKKQIARISFPPSNQSTNINSFSNLFLSLYLALGLVVTLKIYLVLQLMSGGDLSLPNIRQIVIIDFLGERQLNILFKFYYFGVGFCIFLLAYSKQLSKKKIILIIAVGLISAILTTGRLYLLLFFCSSTVLLYRNKIISFYSVIYAFFAFILLFFIIAILLNKGGDLTTTLDSVLWNGQVYTMSSLSCFNDFITTDTQRIDGGALIPNAARSILNIIGMDIPAKPSLLPFSEVPIQCNTYTALFPLYHDGQLFGVFFGMLLIGAFHQMLYLKFRYSNKSTWWYIYSLSLYALVMSVFEDAYFSSPGFWLLLYIPPLLFFLYVAAMSHIRKQKI